MKTFARFENRFHLTVLFFLLCGFSLSAQEIQLSLSKDTIGYNETVVLTISGESRAQSIYTGMPTPDGVMVVGTNETTSYNSNNGKTRFSKTYTLSPYEIGTFTYGPAYAQIGSHRYYSNKVKLVILPGNQASKKIEIFLRCETDKKKVVLGEQIELSLVLYSRVERTLSSDRPVAKTFNGFWYHEGAPIQRLKDTLVFMNGLPYQKSIIYKEYVFPNVSGKLSIPSYSYSCFIKQNPYPTGDPLVDDLMGMPTQIELKSPEVPIEVSQIPNQNQPASFHGDVGEFSLSAEIDHDKIKANEPIQLKVNVKGKGNIKFIQFPATKFPDGFEVFAPVSVDTTSVTENGIEGEKTFSIILIPKNEGKFILPKIEFSYYDPNKRKFVTLHTSEFPIKVEPGDPTKDVSENNLPESFLVTHSYRKIVIQLLLIILIPLTLILILFFLHRKKKKKNELDMELLKKNEEVVGEIFIPIKKTSDLQAMLNVADHFFRNGNEKTGIAQLYETLLTALCEKTELTREEASINQLRFRLELKHFSKDFSGETLELLTHLSDLRYSTIVLSPSQLVDIFQKVSRVCVRLA